MSEKERVVIKEYLKEIKKALPEWLKDKKEHKEILLELEEHIWSKAEELSGSSQPTVEFVQRAIDHMGTPESIAKEYKRRGTPKFYITEELWPSYKNVLAVVFSVIVGIAVVSLILNFIFGNLNTIGDSIMGVQMGFLGSFVVITVIFVVLSMEGYFPEDFKSQKSLEKLKEDDQVIGKKKSSVKSPFKPGEDIVGGSIGIVIGIIFFSQFIPSIFGLMDPEFRLFLQFSGLFIIAEGGLDLMRGLIGKRQLTAHQIIHGITIVVKLASISVVVLMMNRPEIFPILAVEQPTGVLINIGVAPNFYELFRIIAWLVIIAVALSTIGNFQKIVKVERYRNLK